MPNSALHIRAAGNVGGISPRTITGTKLEQKIDARNLLKAQNL
jgi:hypothetical protein